MRFSILRMSKNELELELDELDPTLTELIAEKLNTFKDVEFAASRWDHPLVGKPRLFLKAKSQPLALVEKAIDELIKDVKSVKKVVEKS